MDLRCSGLCKYFETDQDTRVCLECGIEETFIRSCTYKNCGFSMRHSPFLSGYSRTKRFRGMVEALIFPTPCNADTKMLEYLNHTKCKTRGDIIHTMMTSGLKDKRFSSIHLFCRLYDPTYVEPLHGCLFQMLKRMVFSFEHIESRFKQHFSGQNVPFINYTFLIRYLLGELKYATYLPFVKKLKCKKRRTRYNEMLAELELKLPL